MRSEEVDVVILDYMLPDLNGLQFIKTLATEEEFPAFASVPVVVLTARTDYLEELDRYYARNLRAILAKPFGHRRLVNVVENVLRLEKAQMDQLAASRAEAVQAGAETPANSPAGGCAESGAAAASITPLHAAAEIECSICSARALG